MPFEGRVPGIGKYECRVVPFEVRAEEAVANACQINPPLELAPILVEDTEDPDTTPSCEDGQDFPTCGGPCPTGGTCMRDPVNSVCFCQ